MVSIRARRTNLFDPYGNYQGTSLTGELYVDWEKQQFVLDDPLSLNLYTCCANNPIMFADPSGCWTKAIGTELAGAFGLRLSKGKQFVWDDNGNIGILEYTGLGGGTPAVSISGTYTYTDADTIFELSDLGFVVGGSATIPVAAIGGIGVGAEYTTYDSYDGVTISTGAGTSLPELHGELTGTKIKNYTKILQFLGLHDSIMNLLENVFSLQKNGGT